MGDRTHCALALFGEVPLSVIHAIVRTESGCMPAGTHQTMVDDIKVHGGLDFDEVNYGNMDDELAEVLSANPRVKWKWSWGPGYEYMAGFHLHDPDFGSDEEFYVDETGEIRLTLDDALDPNVVKHAAAVRDHVAKGLPLLTVIDDIGPSDGETPAGEEAGLSREKRAIISHHLKRIIDICQGELAGLETQGRDGSREAVDSIEDNTTAILSALEDDE